MTMWSLDFSEFLESDLIVSVMACWFFRTRTCQVLALERYVHVVQISLR